MNMDTRVTVMSFPVQDERGDYQGQLRHTRLNLADSALFVGGVEARVQSVRYAERGVYFDTAQGSVWINGHHWVGQTAAEDLHVWRQTPFRAAM